MAGTGAAASPTTVQLSGRIVTWDGQPIAGAAVALAPSDAMPTAELFTAGVRCDAAGRFSLAAPVRPESDAKYPQLLVAAEGMASIARGVAWKYDTAAELGPFLDARGQRIRDRRDTDVGDVVLPAGGRLFGRVRDEDGKGLEGVAVVATDMLDNGRTYQRSEPSQALCRAVTERSGIFKLSWSLPGLVTLRLSAPGRFGETIEPVGAGTPLEITLRPSGFVRGRVLDDQGRGIVGASVYLNGEHGGSSAAVTTGPAGAFELTRAVDGRFRVRVSTRAERDDRGRITQTSRTGWSDVLDAPVDNLEIVATVRSKSGGGTLRVKAVAADTGEAIAEFRAGGCWQQYANQDASYRDYLLRHAIDNAPFAVDGVAEVAGPGENEVQTGHVRVVAAGFAPTTVGDQEWQDVADGAERTPLVVRLAREATASGRVVDEVTGAPVAGVRVWALPRQDQNRGFYDRDTQRGVTTGDDGTFRLDQLGEGDWQIELQHDDRPRPPSSPLQLGAAEQKTGLELKIGAGAALNGRFAGMDLPIGSRVFLHELPRVSFGRQTWYSSSSSSEVPDTTMAVAADGTFSITGKRPGNYMVVLLLPSPPRCGGALPLPIEPLRLREGGTTRDIDLSADVPGVVDGHVKMSQATLPFDRLVVVAEEVDTNPEAAHMVSYGGRMDFSGPRGFVGKDGSFRIALAPGSWRFRLVDGGTGLSLAVTPEPAKIVAGRTTGVQLDAPLTEVRVRFEPETPGGPIAVVDRLEIRFEPPQTGGAAGGMVVMGGNSDGYDYGVGLAVSPGEKEVAFALGVGKATLFARNSVASLFVDSAQRNGQPPLGREEVEIDAKQAAPRIEVRLKVAAPPVVDADGEAKDGPKGKDESKR